MLNKALRYDIAKLGNETLIHEHLIKLAFFGINQKTSHRFVQVIKDFLKICSWSNQLILCNDKIKDFKEAVYVAIRDFKGDDRALDHQKREAAFEQCFKKDWFPV